VATGHVEVGDRRPPSVSVGDTPRLASWRPTHRGDLLGWLTVAVLAAVTLTSVVRAFGPMTYRGDIWRQSDTATIAHHFFTNGMNLFYPQIDWGGAGPGYVETEFQLVPWLTAGLYHVFGEHAAIGRLLSLVGMLGATAAFWLLARRILPPLAARWALIAFALSPAFMTYGSAFMPDATVLAFTLLAFVGFERWLATDRNRFLAGATAAAATAALLKPTALQLLIVLLVWTLLVDRRRLLRPSLIGAAVLAVVPAALWMWHAHELYLEYGNTFGVLSGGDSKIGGVQFWTSAEFYTGNLGIETSLVYGFAALPLAVVGLWWVLRTRRPVFVFAAVPALVLFYFVTPRYSAALGPHYHLFSLPVAAVLVGTGAAAVAAWLAPRVPQVATRVLAVLAVAAMAVQPALVFAESMRDESGSFGTCATALDELAGPDDLSIVLTDSLAVDHGAANNYQEPVIFYLADRRGWVLAADQQDPALVHAYEHQGAQYLVSHDSALISPDSALAAYLERGAFQVTTQASAGCDIWRLPPA
jgi:hypothetical protein